jgi:pilus assembly protein Flp/PilA
MFRTVSDFLADESGATALEYAMIAALVSVGVVGAIDILGKALNGSMTSVASDLETVAREVR